MTISHCSEYSRLRALLYLKSIFSKINPKIKKLAQFRSACKILRIPRTGAGQGIQSVTATTKTRTRACYPFRRTRRAYLSLGRRRFQRRVRSSQTRGAIQHSRVPTQDWRRGLRLYVCDQSRRVVECAPTTERDAYCTDSRRVIPRPSRP
jgi:hypothetical protein